MPKALYSGKYNKLANLIAGGATSKDAAIQCGLSDRTVAKRISEPEFRAKIASIRGQYVEAGCGRLSLAVVSAANVLIGLLRSDNETTRLRAAEVILEKALRFHEIVEVERKMAEIEERLKGFGDKVPALKPPDGPAKRGRPALNRPLIGSDEPFVRASHPSFPGGKVPDEVAEFLRDFVERHPGSGVNLATFGITPHIDPESWPPIVFDRPSDPLAKFREDTDPKSPYLPGLEDDDHD